MTAGYETLVEAGYSPEMAYFETIHEVKLIVDLIYEGGIANMRYSISNTAEYGDMTRGARVIGAPTREAMKRILADIQSGKFADEWMTEHRCGEPHFRELRKAAAAHPIEQVGKKLRDMMPWLASGRLVAVLPTFRPPAMPVSLVYANRRHLPRRVQVFMTWIELVMRSRVSPARPPARRGTR